MTSPEFKLIELLYDAADNPDGSDIPDDPSGPQLTGLSKRFRKLLHEKFGLSDQHPDLPQLAQLEIPLWHIAKIAGKFDGIDARRDDYLKAIGLGIGRLHDRLGLLDEDVLGLWLSCTRPGYADQHAVVYREEWFRSPKLEGLQHLFTERRLCRLLEHGLLGKDEEEAASKLFLAWIGSPFPENHNQKKNAREFCETLDSLRSSFLYYTADIWKGLVKERRRLCLEALAGGLIRLRERSQERTLMVDLLVLRIIIHWRPWQAPSQVVAAYDALEGISDLLPAAFLESRLRALLNAHIIRLRLPNEFVQVGVASIARSVTTFLCDKEPEGLPSREVLCHWIDEAAETAIHCPLLAIAYAQESLLPPGQRPPGQPRTLKLLPFLGSRSELARNEKHTLLKDLPFLVAALGNLPDMWDDDTVFEAVQSLVQGVAYEWHDRDEGEAQLDDLPKIKRLKKTYELLNEVRQNLPALHRPEAVRAALDEEIALLDQRLRLAGHLQEERA